MKKAAMDVGMKPRFCMLERKRYSKHNEHGCTLCWTNPVSKPSLEILPIRIQHACLSEFLYRFLIFSTHSATMGDVIIYITKVRFVCNIMIYWTTTHISSRQTFLESLWYSTDPNLLCFYYSILKNCSLNQETNVKNW